MNKVKYNIVSIYNVMIIFFVVSLLFITNYTYNNMENIQAQLSTIYTWLNGQNPMIAGAISLWFLGIATFFARNVPQILWTWVIKQTTVTLTINNIDDVYEHFLDWYHASGKSKSSRTLLAKNGKWNEKNDGYNTTISAGYGTHYFIFGGKIFSLERNVKETNMGKEVKETLTLKTIGRNQIQFHDLLIKIAPKKSSKNMTKILKWHNSDRFWKNYGYQQSRSIESIILPHTTKEKITNHIDDFLNSGEWYSTHGIPYRTGLIFHGQPGTGKTSLVNALCDHFNKSLHIISLSGMSDGGLEEALMILPENALVLMEDIDTYSVVSSRAHKDNSYGEELSEMFGLTLSGVLNAIDGIMSSNGRILIATTNYIEKLDSALIRKGRFNLSVEIEPLDDEGFVDFFARFYPDFIIDDNVEFTKGMTQATLQSIIMDNIDNPVEVLKQCVLN